MGKLTKNDIIYPMVIMVLGLTKFFFIYDEHTVELITKMLRNHLTNPPTERWLRDELNTLRKKGIVRAEGATTNRKWLLNK